jgi:para-aminobenzoate synthetase component 1
MRVFERWIARPADLDLDSMFDKAGDRPFALLYGGDESTGYAIYAEAPLCRLSRPEGFAASFERSGDIPAILPDFIGLASYEWGASFQPGLPPPLDTPIPVPGFSFVLYGRVLVHDRRGGLLYEGRRSIEGRVEEPLVVAKEGPSVLGKGVFAARFSAGTEDASSYAAKVEGIRAAIGRGEVYQVNLTRQEEWAYRGDLRGFAKTLYRANPAPFSALIAEPDYAVVSASPERLARLEGGRLQSRPIKGTAPRGANDVEDRRLAQGLLASAKDRSELAMIVDLVRNDLSRACLRGTTGVKAFPVLESYANVHHLVATIEGIYDPDQGLGGLLSAIFPGGSITGCPKIASMGMIRALEAWPRAVYTGSIGWFTGDLSALDLNIAIRSIWADGSRLRFGVGGAVVWDSDPAAEYLETVHKARSILECLNSAKTRE